MQRTSAREPCEFSLPVPNEIGCTSSASFETYPCESATRPLDWNAPSSKPAGPRRTSCRRTESLHRRRRRAPAASRAEGNRSRSGPSKPASVVGMRPRNTSRSTPPMRHARLRLERTRCGRQRVAERIPADDQRARRIEGERRHWIRVPRHHPRRCIEQHGADRREPRGMKPSLARCRKTTESNAFAVTGKSTLSDSPPAQHITGRLGRAASSALSPQCHRAASKRHALRRSAEKRVAHASEGALKLVSKAKAVVGKLEHCHLGPKRQPRPSRRVRVAPRGLRRLRSRSTSATRASRRRAPAAPRTRPPKNEPPL